MPCRQQRPHPASSAMLRAQVMLGTTRATRHTRWPRLTRVSLSFQRGAPQPPGLRVAKTRSARVCWSRAGEGEPQDVCASSTRHGWGLTAPPSTRRLRRRHRCRVRCVAPPTPPFPRSDQLNCVFSLSSRPQAPPPPVPHSTHRRYTATWCLLL